MKKWIFFLSFCLCSLIVAVPLQDHVLNSAALSELARALNIPSDADLIVETQKRWLRKAGQERWEMTELSSEQRLLVLNWANAQGLFSPWKPLLQAYDQALILGATTFCMQQRLDYLRQLWEEGVRFSHIVWLTGDRPLDSRVDAFTNCCQNESEAAHQIWEKADLPKEMRHLPVTFLAVPMKKEGLSLKRPTTEDTIVAWIPTVSKPCKALFVSNQPFCGYQFAVVKGILPKEVLFDVVGPAADPSSHPSAAAITLDSIARWIYEENRIANLE